MLILPQLFLFFFLLQWYAPKLSTTNFFFSFWFLPGNLLRSFNGELAKMFAQTMLENDGLGGKSTLITIQEPKVMYNFYRSTY